MSVGTLCQACGLCCDGTLFSVVPLTEGDAPPRQLEVETKATGARGLRQPCSGLAGTCCTVYEARPLACRRYQCLLYEAMASEEETLAGALRVVEQARALIAAVGPSLAEARAQGRRHEATLNPQLERAEAWLRFHFLGHRRSSN